MKTDRTAVLTAALLTTLASLALTGCAGGADPASTPSVQSPSSTATAASASTASSSTGFPAAAPADHGASPRESASEAPAPDGLYINPVNPAQEGEASFILGWAPGGSAEPVPGTAKNPVGIDYSKLQQDNEQYSHLQYTDVFTHTELEKYAGEGMAQYAALRTDPRFFADRTLDSDTEAVTAHEASLAPLLVDEFESQAGAQTSGSFQGFEVYAMTAVTDPETDESVPVDFTDPLSITFTTPKTYGWVENGKEFMGLEFTEYMRATVDDGRVAGVGTGHRVILDVTGGEPRISGLATDHEVAPVSFEDSTKK